jgi:hypothetical protein
MKKDFFQKALNKYITVINLFAVFVLLTYSISGFTGAWFFSDAEVEPNVFVVEIPEVDADSAWSDGEKGFQKSYFSYTRDSVASVKVYFIQNPQKRNKIGDILVWNDDDYLYLELNTLPRPEEDPPLPGGVMVRSKYHITFEESDIDTGHSHFSEEYLHNSDEAYLYTYTIPLGDIVFNDDKTTYISVKIDFIQE